MLSQLTTESFFNPFAGPTGTSVDNPRTVPVIGATVTLPRCGRTNSRVNTNTGRVLSSFAA
ncbi:hypothetical protein EBESD8_18690 [Rhodococcus aetherivorans]|nr:hypothetical protein EBESD8_18690 [Rhodococcus aetherivorans]